MKIPFHNSIVLKWACLVLVGASAVFLPLLVYLYTESRNIVLGEAERNARNLTRAVAAKIDQEFRAVEKTPENLALMVHRLKDRESVEDMLKRVTAGNKEIYGAALAFEPFAFEPALDRYAPYCYKTESGLAFIDLAVSYDYVRHDWYYIPRILKRPVWTEPYFDEGGGNILMATYSVPMFKNDPNGDPLGIVTADISLEKLGRLASGITVAKSGYCFIVSETGAFVSHPNPALVCRESVFSLSEETDRPELRRIGMLMLREPEGFEDAGTSMGRDSFIAFAKITSTNWVLAAVFPKAELLAEVEVLHTSALYCAIAGMGLLMGMSALMSFSMARRIRRMTPIAAKIGRGELDVDFERLSRKDDEIGRLAQAFAGMVQGLRDRDFIRDTFGRYLTKEVVNRLLESKDGLKLGGETREITIIMSDLRGFTSLTQTMPPTDVIRFLNRYLGKMVEILLDHRGVIDEIIGDGILAFFGAPEPMDDHPQRAVACALAMQAAMDRINDINETEGLPMLEMGIAVNTGDVVVGNIGSERRTKYGAVGAEVNFTGRMESFTVGGQVLISESARARVSAPLDIAQVIEVEMKGVPGKVKLYDVVGLGGKDGVHLRTFEEALCSLAKPIIVHVAPLNRKAVSDELYTGALVSAARHSAGLMVTGPVKKWDDLKIITLPDEHRKGEIYAKAVNVERQGEGSMVVVRFTSVSAAAREQLKVGLGNLGG